MQHDIVQFLTSFRPLFARKAAFIWFIVVIVGFILRFDHYGVSSFVRWLHLPASDYVLLLHFFHASSWSLGDVMVVWMKLCQEKFPLVSLNGRLLTIGDGIKVPKESQCQPGLTYLHSLSQNQARPQQFNGHHFGCIAFVAQQTNTFRGILQAAQMHEGIDDAPTQPGDKPQEQPKTVVSRMMALLQVVAMQQGKPLYAALDALFSTAVAFGSVFNNLQADGSPWVHLITRAKCNYVAYTGIQQCKKQRVKLWDIFDNPSLFSVQPHPLHPERNVKIVQRDLYWGVESFLLRFVWVIDGNKQFILMSSDILLDALDILKCYGLRFQIEFTFRVLKHLLGGFGYRFWSSCCRRTRPGQALATIDKESAVAKKNQLKLSAIERYVNLTIIAQGILSYLAIVRTQWVWDVHHASSWLRSYTSAIPSDEIVQRVLQSQFLTLFSLSLVKYWVNSTDHLRLPDRAHKVRRNNTLGHFLSD
jgi:hypothetical protein